MSCTDLGDKCIHHYRNGMHDGDESCESGCAHGCIKCMASRSVLQHQQQHKKSKPKSMVANLEQETLQNTDYRRVLHTMKYMQIVLMSIKPGEEIGMEVHEKGDQLIRVESGKGQAVFKQKSPINLFDGMMVAIAAGTYHNIINSSTTQDLKLYSIYSPAEHQEGLIQSTKPIIDDDDNDDNK